MDDLIANMIKQGGGWLVAALMLMLYLYERKRNDDQARDRLSDLKQANDAMHKSVSALEKVPDAIGALATEIRVLSNDTRQLQIAAGRNP